MENLADKIILQGPAKDGTYRLEVYEGKALDKKAISMLEITGTPNTVLSFLMVHHHLVKDTESYIVVDKSIPRITLMFNPFGDPFSKKGRVESMMKISDELEKLSINSKRWNFMDLSRLLRMNRHFLPEADRTTKADAIISNLTNIKFKIEKTIEKDSDNRGNRGLAQRQAVEANKFPTTITFFVPVFKNTDPCVLNAEVDIDPDTLECILVVPDLESIKAAQIEKVFSEELKGIQILTEVNLPILYV